VIHKGRLVHQGSIDELAELGGGGVLVTTPTRERLATAVQRAGGRAECQECGGRLVIDGLDAAQVGELAHDEFVAMPLLNIVDETAAGLTPFGAAAVLAGDPTWDALSWADAGLVLSAWTAPLLFAAAIVERRRDLA
jgi:hypothetical protein